MEIFEHIERLLGFSARSGLVEAEDVIYVRNALYDLLRLMPDDLCPAYKAPNLQSIDSLLSPILEYCSLGGIINDTPASKEMMGSRIMGLLTPRPSSLAKQFRKRCDVSPKAATEWFLELCRANNYVQTERMARNEYWTAETDFGLLELTINLSKPEKDPRDIAAALQSPPGGYPKCQLCLENVGFSGDGHKPARQNLRVIPLELLGERWFFQFSPYMYYNEHCVVVNSNHTPMVTSGATFDKLFAFLEIMPHYFIGANADLPIVGGSILSHDHFQGGRHTFPMEKAAVTARYTHESYPGVVAGLLKWPLSVIRLFGAQKEPIVGLASALLERWREYADDEAGIAPYSENNGVKEPHNTITAIARVTGEGCFELDLALRNNRTSPQRPDGIFHPGPDKHHIKKENIGLIEVMGLAILPGRLSGELKALAANLSDAAIGPDTLENPRHPLHAHAQWARVLRAKYGLLQPKAAEGILRGEVAIVFEGVLKDAGVFKADYNGEAQFDRFMRACGCLPL